MSLINEALKRAESEKNSNSPEAVGSELLTPVEQYSRRRGSPLVGLALIAAVIGAGIGAWLLFGTRDRPALPAQADAAQPRQAESPRRASAAGDADQQVDLAIAKTLEAVRYYQPPPSPAPARNAGRQRTGPRAVDLPDFGDRAGPPATPPADPKPLRPAAATASPPAPKPRRNPGALDQSKFKLSAIMQGSNGARAIINGVFVTVGMTLDGAKVVKIGDYTVEMEIEGRKFTIQM